MAAFRYHGPSYTVLHSCEKLVSVPLSQFVPGYARKNRVLHARIREAAVQQDEAQTQALELATNGMADLNRLMSENARLRNELAASRRPPTAAAAPRKSAAATNVPQSELPAPVLAFAAQSTGEIKPGETLVSVAAGARTRDWRFGSLGRE